MDAARGIERELEVSRQSSCEACSGSGQARGTGRRDCTTCGGSGHITQRQGFFVLQSVCPVCHGEGSRIEKPCHDCGGRGRVLRKSTLSVKIPAGIEDGMQLVLRGQGEQGERGGHSGDLYVAVQVEAHEFFQRNGTDILLTVPISFPQAALGTKMKVPTLEGEVEIDVHAGTESGDELRLKGKGLASVHGGRHKGDEIVRFVMKTPKKLTRRQRELLEALLTEE
jgi:molecular chaperone DnaJ